MLVFIWVGTALLSTPSVYGCTISPVSSDFGVIVLGGTSEQTFTVTTLNETCDISPSTQWISFSKTHFIPNQAATVRAIINVPLTATIGSYTEYITLSDGNKSTVSFTASTSNVGGGSLEPTFTSFSKKVEENTVFTKTLSLRNRYSTAIEITRIELDNAVITREGIAKPVDIDDIETGMLQPGNDRNINVLVNSVDVPVGSYTTSLVVTYYYGGDKKTLTVPFDIFVVKSFVPTGMNVVEVELKNMEIEIIPPSPSPNDAVTAIARDSETRQVLDAPIKVLTFSGNELLTTFIYYEPFKTGSGKKVCLNVTKEGYHSISRCFLSEIKLMRIKFSPSNPTPDDTIMIQLVGMNGNLVMGGSLKIGDTVYDESQVTINLEEGGYMIVGSADGYDDITTTLSIAFPIELLEILQQPALEIAVGDNVTVVFNRATDWIVFFNDTVVVQDVSDTLYLVPQEAGVYSISAEGGDLGTFEVGESSNLLSQVTGEIIAFATSWYVILVLVLGVGLFLNKKKGPNLPSSSSIPKSDRFALPMRKVGKEEGEE